MPMGSLFGWGWGAEDRTPGRRRVGRPYRGKRTKVKADRKAACRR